MEKSQTIISQRDMLKSDIVQIEPLVSKEEQQQSINKQNLIGKKQSSRRGLESFLRQESYRKPVVSENDVFMMVDSQRQALIGEEIFYEPRQRYTSNIQNILSGNEENSTDRENYIGMSANPSFIQKRQQIQKDRQFQGLAVTMLPKRLNIKDNNRNQFVQNFIQPSGQLTMKSEKTRQRELEMRDVQISPKTAALIKKSTVLQPLTPIGDFQHLVSVRGFSGISPLMKRGQNQRMQKQSTGGNSYIQTPNKKSSMFASKVSGGLFLNHQQTILSESQSENDQTIKARLNNAELQNKNIKNFKSVLKEKKKAQKEKQKKQKGRKRLGRGRSSETSFQQRKSLSGTQMGGGLKRFKVIDKKITNMTTDIKKTTLTSEENEETNEDDFKRIERQFQRSKYTIYPDSNFKTIWDFGSFIQIIFWALILPFQLAFQQQMNSFFKASDIFTEAWFLVDILISFNTGFQEKGMLLMNRRKIIKHYFKSWFIFDFIISFPYDWVLIPIQQSIAVQQSANVMSFIKFIRYLKILRLIRVIKVEGLLTHLEDHIVSDMTNALLRFFKLMIMTFFFAHWMACLFYAVAAKSMDKYGESWITQTQVQDSPISEQYVNALYWCITTMATVGYGDIKPQTMEERGVNIIIMAIAAGVYAYILNDVGHIVSNYNIIAAQYKEKMQYVNQFLITKGIPKDLRDKIYRYFDYNWELKKKIKIDEEELMDLLNNDLRNQIKSHLTGRILLNVGFFEKNFEVDFLSQITHIFNQKSYAVDDNIIYEDQVGDEIFFIIHGRVAIIHKKSHTYIQDLSKDQYFGEISFFGDIPRICSGKSRDFTDVYTIKREDFLSIAEAFSSAIVYFIFCYLAYRVVCYVCGKKKDHVSLDCPNFRAIAGNLKTRYNKVHGITNDQQQKGDTAISTPFIFIQNNLLVPRQSFSKNSSSYQMNNNQENPIILENYAQPFRDSTLTDELDEDEDVYKEQNMSQDNSILSFDQQQQLVFNNGGLEDIQEDTLLEDSDFTEEIKQRRTLTPFQRQSTQQSRQNTSRSQIQEHLMQFKRTTTDINSNGSKKTSKLDLSHLKQVQRDMSVTMPINEESDSSKIKTDKDEKQQNVLDEREKEIFRQQEIQACKIRPLRGIRKNTMTKKFRIKTGKIFTEDYLEELIRTSANEQAIMLTPKKVSNQKIMDYSNNQDQIGLLTMISSRDSQEWNSQLNNSQANLIKISNIYKKKSYFGQKDANSPMKGFSNSQHIKVQPANKISQILATENKMYNKQMTSNIQKQNEEHLQLSQFQKIKNINFAANLGNIQRSQKSNSNRCPSTHSELSSKNKLQSKQNQQ